MIKKIVISLGIVLFLSAGVFADTLCMFQGDINFIQRVFQMQINFREKEKITAQLKFPDANNYYFNTQIEHIKFSRFDFSTNLESTGWIIKDEKSSLKALKGWLWSNYSLLNYKPFREMAGAFELQNGRLILSSFAWGDILVNGNIDLAFPYNLALVLEINQMDIEELAPILGVSLDDLVLKGQVSGKLKIEGPLSNPHFKGQIRASQGSIDEFDYKDIFINLEGDYPWLNIVDSGIIEEDGMSYNLKGRLDLRELNNFKNPAHIMIVSPSGEEGFNWQGWKVKRQDMFGSNDDLEFEYKLKANGPFGIRFKDSQEILGIEHKIKF